MSTTHSSRGEAYCSGQNWSFLHYHHTAACTTGHRVAQLSVFWNTCRWVLSLAKISVCQAKWFLPKSCPCLIHFGQSMYGSNLTLQVALLSEDLQGLEGTGFSHATSYINMFFDEPQHATTRTCFNHWFRCRWQTPNSEPHVQSLQKLRTRPKEHTFVAGRTMLGNQKEHEIHQKLGPLNPPKKDPFLACTAACAASCTSNSRLLLLTASSAVASPQQKKCGCARLDPKIKAKSLEYWSLLRWFPGLIDLAP